MSDDSLGSTPYEYDAARRIDSFCDQYEADVRTGTSPQIESILTQVPEQERRLLLSELLKVEFEILRRRGEQPDVAAYAQRFSAYADMVHKVFGSAPRLNSDSPTASTPNSSPPPSVGASSGATGFSNDAGEEVGGGRFRAMRPHAQGALGRIWVAMDVELKREVALKEILPEQARHIDRRERFVLEAEVTGRLEHPGIVPVYGLGLAPDGRPFYAMRFVHGQSLEAAIAAFHRPDKLDSPFSVVRAFELRKLLGRFVAICNAIDFAHSRGIVHRDIKPANVMLGEYGETLVVDWGLAKVLPHADPTISAKEDASLSGSASQTCEGMVFGTPQYMSPEQAAGDVTRIGTTSDVYSLGATLYHLLTGKPAFGTSAVKQVLEAVQRSDFPPPRRLHSSIPRSLEAICLKAMACEPQERYASARQLADDLEHWLADEPVIAFRDPWSARVGRFARRHRQAVQFGAAGLLAVAVVSVTASVIVNQARKEEIRQRQRAEGEERAAGAARATAERERQAAIDAREAEARQRRSAEEQERRARASTDFLVSVFDSTDPLGLRGLGLRRPTEPGKALSPREMLDHGLERVDRELKAEPLLQATLYDALGMAYFGQGELEKAEMLVDRAWEMRRARLEEPHPDMLASKLSRAIFMIVGSRIPEAESLLKETLAGQQASPATRPLMLSNTQFFLALSLQQQYRLAEAEQLLRAALATRELELGIQHPDTSLARIMLVDALQGQNKSAEAQAEVLKLLTTMDITAAPTFVTGLVRFHLLEKHRGRREYDAAVGISQSLLADSSRTLGDSHPVTVALSFHHAALLHQQGNLREAEQLTRRTIEQAPLFVTSSPRMAEPYFKLAQALADRGDHTGAERFYRAAIRFGGAIYVRENAWGLRAGLALSNWLRERGQLAEAEKVCRETIARIPDHDDQLRINAESHLYSVLLAQTRLGEAQLLGQTLFERHWARRSEAPGAAIAWGREFARCLRENADYPRALAIEQATFELGNELAPTLDIGAGGINLHDAADCLLEQGNVSAAQNLMRLSLAEVRALTIPGHSDAGTCLLPVADWFRRIDKHDEAAALLREVVATCRDKLGEDHVTTQQGLLSLALSEQSLGRSEEAVAKAREAFSLRQTHFGDDDPRTLSLAREYAGLLQRQQKFSEAEPLLRSAVERFAALLPIAEPRRWQSHLDLADLLLAKGDFATASAMLTSLRDTMLADLPSELADKKSWRIAEVSSRLGSALSEQRSFVDAQPLLLDSLATLRTAWPATHPRVREAARRVVRHYELAGDDATAETHRPLAASTPRVADNTVRLALQTAGQEATFAVHAFPVRKLPSAMMTHMVAGDFDGDQRSDLFFWSRHSGANMVASNFAAPDPSDSRPPEAVTEPFTTWSDAIAPERAQPYTHVVAGDFNGDGRDDLFFWHSSSGANLVAMPSESHEHQPRFDLVENPGAPAGLNGRELTHVTAGRFRGGKQTGLFFWHPHTGMNALAYFDSTQRKLEGDRRPHDQNLAGGQFAHVIAGDFDGDSDRRDDLWFWNPRTGANLVAFARADATSIAQFATRENIVARPAISNLNFESVSTKTLTDGRRPSSLFFWHPATGASQLLMPGENAPDSTPLILTNPLPTESFRDRVFALHALGDFNGDKRLDVVFATGR